MSQPIQTLDEATLLMWDILKFLYSCGSPYDVITTDLQRIVLESLATGRYVWEPDNYYVAYWRIAPQDVEDVLQFMHPLDRHNGSVVYIVEMANKKGKQGITQLTQTLRRDNPTCKGVCWHRGLKNKRYYFPKQGGIQWAVQDKVANKNQDR